MVTIKVCCWSFIIISVTCSIIISKTIASHLDWVAEELQEAKVIPSGQKLPVFGERGSIDVRDVALCRPDALTGGAQYACPGGPFHPLDLGGGGIRPPTEPRIGKKTLKIKLIVTIFTLKVSEYQRRQFRLVSGVGGG